MVSVIIAEKPDAAMRLAQALSNGRPEKKTSEFGVDYYEFTRNGKKHIVVAAVGHLFNLKQAVGGWTYPIFDVKWIPSYEAVGKSAFSEKYFKTIQQLAKNGSEYFIACDYDTEGSVIGYNILKFLCEREDARRMKFSTLTKPDLVKAYEEASPHLDIRNIEAGIARHTLDFYYGINTSRALTLAIKKSSPRFAVLSAGRVQGPTLSILAEKEQEIMKFKPKPFWQIQINVNIGGQEVIAVYEEDKVWSKDEAEKIFKETKGKNAVVESVTTKQYRQSPPNPFNITSLQTESYRLFGYSPQQTLNIAQGLYTRAYVSYPRTSSEKLPPQIGYKEILKAVASLKKYKELADEILKQKELKPTEGKGVDSAHEAIHPTIEPPEDIKRLRGPEQKIYDLIVRRYLTHFATESLRESMQIVLNVNGYKFVTTGRRTVEKGWMKYYGPYARLDEIVLPELEKGDKVATKKTEMLSKETQPPPRFSQASIIKEMDKRGLGTRATRAAILQTLYDRGYVADKSVRVTSLGLELAKVLKKYVPDFVDEKLTKHFDAELDKILQGKAKKEKIFNEAKKALIKICEEFKKNEINIGKELGKAIVTTQEDVSTLGVCKNCGGNLKVLFSIFTKKHFVGCTNYNKCKICGFSKKACKCKCGICGQEKGKCKDVWKDKTWNPVCNTGYPLPHGASFQRLDKTCEKCGTPMITVIRKGKRPFRMCLDPKCETKKDWGKPRKGKKAIAVKVKAKKK